MGRDGIQNVFEPVRNAKKQVEIGLKKAVQKISPEEQRKFAKKKIAFLKGK